jgi:hypothetical protein
MRGRKTGGRVAGTPNKVTAELREAAQAYTETALQELARLATGAQSEAARVAACRELLDRGHGRAPQGITLTDDRETGPIILSWRKPTGPDEPQPNGPQLTN